MGTPCTMCVSGWLGRADDTCGHFKHIQTNLWTFCIHLKPYIIVQVNCQNIWQVILRESFQIHIQTHSFTHQGYKGANICICLQFNPDQSNGLRAHLIRPKTEKSETAEQARNRARSCVDGVNYQLLLQMNHADRVRLECRQRV